MTPVRIAVIDSGVHASHPHVNGVAGGIGVAADGTLHDEFVDRVGHGTAVTAAIKEKAPLAEILAVRVFDRELAATGAALVAACAWAADQRATIVNLSLGTQNADHASALAEIVERLRACGAVVIAAAPDADHRWLPGSLPGVWKVTLDWSLSRDECRAATAPDGEVTFRASGFPRPIPGVPPERNLKGVSFAVANVTGLVAALFASEPSGDPVAILQRAIAREWRG